MRRTILYVPSSPQELRGSSRCGANLWDQVWGCNVSLHAACLGADCQRAALPSPKRPQTSRLTGYDAVLVHTLCRRRGDHSSTASAAPPTAAAPATAAPAAARSVANAERMQGVSAGRPNQRLAAATLPHDD